MAATSSDRRVVEGALKRLKIMDCFARIFTCTEIGAGKDQPDIYLAAAAFMGTRPEETWVFEDALYALETAKKAGFRTVGVFDAFSAGDQGRLRRSVTSTWRSWPISMRFYSKQCGKGCERETCLDQ